MLFMTFDTSGRPVGGVDMTERPSQAQLDETFVHVPWAPLPAQPGDDPRQVRISYPAAEPCATFDHLEVHETDTSVEVRVWLRHTSSDPTGCTPTARHTAIVGLTRPLAQRTLVDEDANTRQPAPAPSPTADGTSK